MKLIISPSSVEVKKRSNYICTSLYVFMTLCLINHGHVSDFIFARLRWSRGSVLAFGTQVREFKQRPKGEKILSMLSFVREVKQFVPCRIFATCKRTRKCMRGSRSFRSKLQAISRPSSSSFHYQGLWWRHLAVQVGKTKDQSL